METNHLRACPARITGAEENCSCGEEEVHYLTLAKWSGGLFLFEFIGGWNSGSLALMSDALHVLIDGGENLVSVIVSRFARRGDEEHVRKIGGLISAGLLLLAATGIIHEGTERLSAPHKIEWYMTIIAIIGLGVNIQQRKLHDNVSKEHRNDTHFWQNWHLISDSVASVVVIVGGIIMLATEQYYWIDGALSILIGIFIMVLVCAKLLGFDLHRHDHEHARKHYDCDHDHP